MKAACFFTDHPALLDASAAALADLGVRQAGAGGTVWLRAGEFLWRAEPYGVQSRSAGQIDGVFTATNGDVVDTASLAAFLVECRSEGLVALTAKTIAAHIAPYRLWVQGDDETLWPGSAVDPDRLLM